MPVSSFQPQSELWTRLSADGEFKFVKSSFKDSYLDSILRFADQDFISRYGKNGHVRRATFAEFHADLCRAATEVLDSSSADDVVVTLAGNTYECVVYMLAAIMLGRTICPMNPDDGLKRIQEKCGLICQSHKIWMDPDLIEKLPIANSRPMTLLESQVPKKDLEFQNFKSDQPIVLVFTSGSTGYSKIVEQMEVGLLTNIDALIERHRLGPGEVVATPLPVFHVNALEFALCSTLLSGAKLVLFESGALPVLFAGLRAEKCTILSVVPTVVRLLVERSEDWLKLELSTLRYIVTAAAPLSMDLAKSVTERLKLRLIQGYGLSEAINFSCLMPVDLSESEYLRWSTGYPWPSVGTPLRGSQVFVLGESGHPLGEGEIGEIGIRGPTVMRGYRGDREKAVFLGSYLRTGDLGLFHTDDKGRCFFFVSGRIKDTIKRNGLTVSLREIDDLLAGFRDPGFDAISVGFQNNWTGEDLGVVILKTELWNAESERRLVKYLESALPAHLRPRLVLRTRRNLRTASGKPCRWHFQNSFLKFQSVLFGSEVRFEDEPVLENKESV